MSSENAPYVTANDLEVSFSWNTIQP